jgi:hypothetical protein
VSWHLAEITAVNAERDQASRLLPTSAFDGNCLQHGRRGKQSSASIRDEPPRTRRRKET